MKYNCNYSSRNLYMINQMVFADEQRTQTHRIVEVLRCQQTDCINHPWCIVNRPEMIRDWYGHIPETYRRWSPKSGEMIMCETNDNEGNS